MYFERNLIVDKDDNDVSDLSADNVNDYYTRNIVLILTLEVVYYLNMSDMA